jgi:hypothetical protein
MIETPYQLVKLIALPCHEQRRAPEADDAFVRPLQIIACEANLVSSDDAAGDGTEGLGLFDPLVQLSVKALSNTRK